MAKRFSDEQKQKHLQELEHSGKTIRRYGLDNQLKPATIMSWKRKFASKKPDTLFREIPIPRNYPSGLTIEYPNGVKLHINQTLAPGFIKELIR